MVRGEVMWWYATRNELFNLLKRGWQGTLTDLAQSLQVSIKWVKKWKTRLKPHLHHHPTEAELNELFKGYSCVPHHIRQSVPVEVVLENRIVHFRNILPQELGRVAGAKTISYYLSQDVVLAEQGIAPTGSTSIIYKVLRQHHLVAPLNQTKRATAHRPQTRALPMHTWELDFTDVTTIKHHHQPDSTKKAHWVEVLNVVDAGTSIAIASKVDDEFNAETATRTVATLFKERGLPQLLRIDRDPRLVGGYAGQDYPSAFERMCYCLGLPHLEKCPPRRPDKKGFVERFHRTQGEECFRLYRPATKESAAQIAQEWLNFYNQKRPHQGLSCANQPPMVAFSELPALKSVPMIVNPDAWLLKVANLKFTRKVSSNGGVSVDKYDYYISSELVGQRVLVAIDSLNQQLVISHHHEEIKRVAIKGLVGREMNIDEYIEFIALEARSEQKNRDLKRYQRYLLGQQSS